MMTMKASLTMTTTIIMMTMAHDDHRGQDGHGDYDGFGVVTQPTTYPCLSFFGLLGKKRNTSDHQMTNLSRLRAALALPPRPPLLPTPPSACGRHGSNKTKFVAF